MKKWFPSLNFAPNRVQISFYPDGSLLEDLRLTGEVETHLVMSRGAIRILEDETEYSYQDICKLADVVHEETEMGAIISSGSIKTDGMIIAPCSM